MIKYLVENWVFKISALFQLLFCDIKYKNEASVNVASIKACLQDTTFTSYSVLIKILPRLSTFK